MMNSKNHISEESTPSGALSIRGVSNSAGSVPNLIYEPTKKKKCSKCKEHPVHRTSRYCIDCHKKRIAEQINCTKCKKIKDSKTSVWCSICRAKWKEEKINCTKCGEPRDLKKNIWCKKCMKEYRRDHKVEIALKHKSYRQKNKDKVKEYRQNYRQKPGGKEKRNAKERDKKKRDPMYRIRCNLGTRIWFFLRDRKKSVRTMELVGCDFKFLKKHLESQFTRAMQTKATIKSRKIPKCEQKIIIAYKGNTKNIVDLYEEIGRL